jgi:hypothetical protein
MTGKRKRAEALVAQSIYEPLTNGERSELDGLLDAFPDLKEDAAQLRAFRDRLPASDVELGGDLRPAVMAALHQQRGVRFPILPHWAIALTAFVLVASGVMYWIAMHPPAAIAPGPVAETPATDSVGAALADVDALIASRAYGEAYAQLAELVDAHPEDPRAGEACQRMADIAFDDLQWYSEAFAAYDVLRHRYADQFRAAPTNFTRLNLLDEQRGTDNQFAGLRALDNARGDDDFGSLEELASRNPATYLASAASIEMARIAAADEGFDPRDNPVRALRAARFRSGNPVTKSQLKFELAQLFAASPDERERARELFEELANGSVTTLANAARRSLTDLENSGPNSPQL